MFFDLIDNKEKIYKKKIFNIIDESKDNIIKTERNKSKEKIMEEYCSKNIIKNNNNNIKNFKSIKKENNSKITIKKVDIFDKKNYNEKNLKKNNIINDELNPKHEYLKTNDISITDIKIIDIKKNINKNPIINSTKVFHKNKNFSFEEQRNKKIKKKIFNFILIDFNYKKNIKMQKLKKKEKENELKNKFNLKTSQFKKQNLNILPIDKQFIKISHFNAPKNDNNIILSKFFNIISYYYLYHYFPYFIARLKKIKEKKIFSKKNIIKEQTKNNNFINLKIIKNNEFNIFKSDLNKKIDDDNLNLLFKCFGDAGKNLSGIKTFPRPYIEIQNNKPILFKIFKNKINDEDLKIQNNNNINFLKEENNIDIKNKGDSYLFKLSKMFNRFLLKEDDKYYNEYCKLIKSRVKFEKEYFITKIKLKKIKK